MKMKLLLLLISQICISQTNKLNQLLLDGEKAFFENNFLLAKEIFTKATNLDSTNKDCWYNLAVSELKLGENENACEHLYQAFLLFDNSAIESIKEYCPNFKNGSIMLLNDVEEKPKFIYNGKEYLLFINNGINQKYTNLLIKNFKKSKILMQKVTGRVYINFQVSNSDRLDVKVLKFDGDQNYAEIVEKEILYIFNNLATYISAKNKGVNVDLWDKWALTIYFNNQSF